MQHKKLSDARTMPKPESALLTPGKIQNLSPQLRKAARFVIDNPGEIATRSQRYIAKKTNLSAPTFTRLARAMGYQTYDDLRDVCRSEVLNKRTFLAEKAKDQIHKGNDEATFVVQNIEASVRNLETTLAGLDPEELKAIVSALARSRSVVLAGMFSAKSIMEYAAYLGNMAVGKWRAIGLEVGALANDLVDIDQNDACIFFSVQPYASKTIELAKIMVARNVPIIVITDSPASPVAAYATHCIYTETESSQFFPSHGAAIVILETLIGVLIQATGPKAQERIAKIEQQNHQLRDYWRDEPNSNKGENK